MYQFSRSIFRELGGIVIGADSAQVATNRVHVLRACERTMERIGNDSHYFARPTRSLFREIRIYFPLNDQKRVYWVIQRHVDVAAAYIGERARAGVTFDGRPRPCVASTRKGTACARTPLPGRRYCPSHQHLEDEAAAA